MSAAKHSPLVASAFYFAGFGALGALMPFLPLTFTARGFDALSVGLVLGVIPLVDMLAPPLWGIAADRWQAGRGLLVLASLLSAASVLALLYRGGVGITALLVALFCLFRSPLAPLADASCRAAGATDGGRYGRVRVWGSIGFASSAAFLGSIGASDATVILTASALYVAAALIALGLPRGVLALDAAPSVLAGLGQQLRQRSMLLLLLGTALYYAGHATFDAFIPLHLKALGFSRAYVGWVWGLGVGAEVVALWHAPRWFGRLEVAQMLVLCAAVAVLRWLLLASAVHPLAILATQLLHGVTFGVWYVALVDAVQRDAPAHLRSSLMTVTISSIALGRVAGYGIGGLLLRAYGGAALYLLAATLALLGMMVYALRLRYRS